MLTTVLPLLSSWVASPAAHAGRLASSVRLSAADPLATKLKGMLDQLPVFTVANGEGQPLQYQINGQPLAVFYADIDAAKTELANTQKEFPELGADLSPIGLGSAYKLVLDGKGMVVPGIADLQACGAPPDAQPMGQELPLFACMQMSQDSEKGSVLPLFMSYADCAAALAQASPEESFEISPLALPSVLERLTGLDDPTEGGFSFVPPSASIKHIDSYVGNGIYWRPVDDDAPAEGAE